MADPTKQVDKFKAMARELETDESEENFDRILKKIIKSPTPKPDKPPKKRPFVRSRMSPD